MELLKKKEVNIKNGILYIDIDKIKLNPNQPRQFFDQKSLRELSESISEFGIINPLTVRKNGAYYELIAGERRLRGARLSNFSRVPCLVMDVGQREASLIALVENIQRRDLDFVEEAEGIYQLIKIFNLSQDEAAKKLGKSQSGLANKLRILKLPREILDILRENELTERHGRALLRLPCNKERLRCALLFAQENMNVASAENYVEKLLIQNKNAEINGKKRKSKFVLKDFRIFMNTISHSLDLMKKGGIDAKLNKEETEKELIVTISIAKSLSK